VPRNDLGLNANTTNSTKTYTFIARVTFSARINGEGGEGVFLPVLVSVMAWCHRSRDLSFICGTECAPAEADRFV